MTADADPHGLTGAIAYGPVLSRRYGRTLGLNVLPPGRKECRYSCVYCQLGHARAEPAPASAYPLPHEIREAVAAFEGGAIDALVLCGNGEPTLHPRFPEVLEALREARDARFPGRPIVCLTSGSELHRHEVTEAMRLLEECAVKLDAGRCATLRKIALPLAPACVDWLTWRIRALGDAVIQTCFLDGPVSNSSDAEVEAWIEAVRASEPARVDIYSIARRPPSTHLRPLASERLVRIAARLRAATGLSVRAIV